MLGGRGSHFQGQVAEALLFPEALDAAARQAVSCGLGVKFGLKLKACKGGPGSVGKPHAQLRTPKCPTACQHGRCESGACRCSAGYFGEGCDAKQPSPGLYRGLKVWLSGHRFDSSMAAWPGNTWPSMPGKPVSAKLCRKGLPLPKVVQPGKAFSDTQRGALNGMHALAFQKGFASRLNATSPEVP